MSPDADGRTLLAWFGFATESGYVENRKRFCGIPGEYRISWPNAKEYTTRTYNNTSRVGIVLQAKNEKKLGINAGMPRDWNRKRKGMPLLMTSIRCFHSSICISRI